MGVFNTPQNEPYIETYLTLSGNSLFAREIKGKFQNSVNIQLTVFKDSTIVKANKYNLQGPLFSDSIGSPVFIDNQRYSIPNGAYRIEISITDNYNPHPVPLVFKEKIVLAYNNKDLQASSIEALESFKKVPVPSQLSKSGYEMICYTTNYYPESSTELPFYFEAYNTDTVLGKDKFFIYYYYIENSANFSQLSGYGSFKKQACARVNPLLAKINIANLVSGNYNLVIEIKDEHNIMHLQSKYFFQRLNNIAIKTTTAEDKEAKTLAAYFGNCNNADSLKMFVECLWPIANAVDKDRTINQALKKDPALMKKFVVDFWERRAADTANPLKMWNRYYKRVQEAMSLFKCGNQPGYYTDRGRVYLQYGKPNLRAQQNAEQNTFPYEIWQYYKITDGTNSQSFSNRKFVFVNKILGADCYNLIHSDMRGEITNSRWQYEITRNGASATGLDGDSPTGTETNQFNEIYNNPR